MELDHEIVDGIATVTIRGEVDVHSAGRLYDVALGALREEGASGVVVDCQEVTFIDSTGIGVLVLGHREATAKGGALRLRSVSPPLQRLLELTGLEGAFPIDE